MPPPAEFRWEHLGKFDMKEERTRETSTGQPSKEEEEEEEEECDVTCVYTAKRAGGTCDHGRQCCPLCSYMVEGGNLCSDCFS